MAAKKKATKKKSSRRRSASPAMRPGDCSLPKVCKYLAEWDKYWRVEILPRYIKLQRAMCHLERVVLDGKIPDPTLRRCSGVGGGVEPPDPPPPPAW